MTTKTTREKIIKHDSDCDINSNVGMPKSQKDESYCTCGKTKTTSKKCLNCEKSLDSKENVIPKFALLPVGKSIYFKILDGKFRSIELCNLCYSVMEAYRHGLSKEERANYELKKEK